jgi:hypothetical protein
MNDVICWKTCRRVPDFKDICGTNNDKDCGEGWKLTTFEDEEKDCEATRNRSTKKETPCVANCTVHKEEGENEGQAGQATILSMSLLIAHASRKLGTMPHSPLGRLSRVDHSE